MNFPLQRCRLAALPRVLLITGWCLIGAVSATAMPLDDNSVQSISGQFVVSTRIPIGFGKASLPERMGASTIRLEPALLSVTAERIKQHLWQTLGVPASVQWQGNIFLVLHSARRWDEPTPISAQLGARGWNYRVDLPDALLKANFVRAMTSAVLFELAEHGLPNSPRSPELPAWLVDGLSQSLMTEDKQNLVLAPPEGLLNGLPQSRQESTRHGIDSLVAARQILRSSAPVTFAQMSWPSDDQINGQDGGAYLASAQVFVSELLKLPDGPNRLMLFLNRLPQCENWQTAFQDVYQTYFPQPLDVEKWWSLRAINFTAHEPGPAWTAEVGRQKLNELLMIPVEVRTSSNSMPAHIELTLQQAILKVNYAQQETVLTAKVGELGLARLRMVPSLAGLTEGYRQVLSAYLGQRLDVSVASAGRSQPKKAGLPETLKKLNRLDLERAAVEAKIKPDVLNVMQN